jgi:hypothetical protein
MKFSILTYNNKVGIVTDAKLLHNVLSNIQIESNIVFIDKLHESTTHEIGIWIQDFNETYLELFKKNILYINEEWYCRSESELDLFEYVICKNSYAYDLLKHRNNVIYIPFISKNVYDSNIRKDNKLLHFAGRSIQKNTELILTMNNIITFIDPDNKWASKYQIPNSFEHITSYLSDDELKYHLNNKSIHICCSLYESWGHYAFEGLSTGAHLICSDIPVFRDQLDPELVTFITTYQSNDLNLNYWYESDNIKSVYQYRTSFHINESELQYAISNQLNFPDNLYNKRMLLFDSIIQKNTKLIQTFFKNI